MLRSFSMTVKGTFEGKLFRSWMFYFHIVKIHWISLNSLKASREGDASILRKNLSSIPWDKYVRWFLDLPNFVKAYQTSKTPSSCLGAGQYLRGNETINMEDSYLGMLHDDPFAQYNYYGSQVYVNVPAASPGPSSAQFVHPYVHPSQPSTSTSASFTTTCNQIENAQAMVLISLWLTLVVNKYFAVIQCTYAWQIKNLAETNFVEIFERAKQILSVQCVQTHRKEKETHELIFSWLSWLAVLLVGAYARRRRRRRSCPTWRPYSK